MFAYVLKRLGLMVLTLFLIITLCFFVIRLMPGSPFDDPESSPQLERLLEEKHHLHEPIHVQYYYFWHDIVTEGYWGVSLKIEPNVPVWQVLKNRIPVTLCLNLLSLCLAIPIGILAGALITGVMLAIFMSNTQFRSMFDEYAKGWYIPSQGEWAAFAHYFSSKVENALTTSNCNIDYGLQSAGSGYWSSSVENSVTNYSINFTTINNQDTFDGISIGSFDGASYVRLGATF